MVAKAHLEVRVEALQAQAQALMLMLQTTLINATQITLVIQDTQAHILELAPNPTWITMLIRVTQIIQLITAEDNEYDSQK